MNSAWWRMQTDWLTWMSFVVAWKKWTGKVCVCVWLVRGGGLANFLATHHPQPFPEQNDKCCVVHPAVMRRRAHENILLLLMTRRKYTMRDSYWSSSQFLKHTSFSPRKRKTSRWMEQRCCGAGDWYCYESWRCLRCQSALSGVVNNSSSFVKNGDFYYKVVVFMSLRSMIPIGEDTFREVLSHSHPALTGNLNAT